MTETDIDRMSWMRPFAWTGSTALILLPLLATKLADPRAWAIADLPFALVMIAAVGLAFEFALRIRAGWTFRAGAALAAVATLLLTWGNLAVGFAGSENEPINLVFLAGPAIALAGSVAAGFRPAGLATAMAAAAAAQLVAGLVALHHGFFTGPLTVTFTGLWLASALMFLRSSRALNRRAGTRR